MENESSSSEKFSMMPDAMPRISLDEMLTCLKNYMFERIGVRDDDKNASNRLHEIDHHLAQWFCRHGVELVCDRPDNISANNPNIAEQQGAGLNYFPGGVAGERKISMTTREQQLADAYEAVAKANHYMIGIVEQFSDDELEAAKQILIERQNALVGHHWPLGSPGYRHFHRQGGAFARLNLALDLIEAEQARHT